MCKYITMIERGIHGQYIIYGEIGRRIYIMYTLREAKKRYNEECRKFIAENRRNEA